MPGARRFRVCKEEQPAAVGDVGVCPVTDIHRSGHAAAGLGTPHVALGWPPAYPMLHGLSAANRLHREGRRERGLIHRSTGMDAPRPRTPTPVTAACLREEGVG